MSVTRKMSYAVQQSPDEGTRGDASGAQPPASASMIGPKVRSAREAQNMSLRELARRIDMSPSFVSQLEHNKAKPSVGTLYALVEALGVSMDQLMSREPGVPGPDVGVVNGDKTTSFDDDREPLAREWPAVKQPLQPVDSRARIQFPGVLWERLTQAPDPHVDFLHVEYSPGSSSCPPDDMMRHGGHEYGFVLFGRLELQVGFDKYTVRPGDAVSFDSMTPHRLSNPHDEPCRAIWVVVGRSEDKRGRNLPSPSGNVSHLPSMST
jgi:transcriptional regulator with XRE-family HTH domain